MATYHTKFQVDVPSDHCGRLLRHPLPEVQFPPPVRQIQSPPLMTCRAQVRPVPPININRNSQRRQIINNNSIKTFMPICIHAVV